MTQPNGYTRTQILLHWATVGLVALQYLLHDGVSSAYDRALETGDYVLSAPVALHAGGGMAILILAVVRLLLRKEQGVPAAPAGEPPLFQAASKAAHLGFYALLFLLPISGAIAWGGRAEGAGSAHEALKTLLLVLIVAHVGAVVIHQVVWKTGLMRRMMTPRHD